ncbi:hypothetical protein BC940DRAFT_238797 [Gongronella butleri]|nr:hypothetical protein BC940DRAFT_238797 [Gongronella butleri]
MKRHALVPTQPIFANLISQCLKAHQIDRAWDTFDAMRLSYHQPDEVTFTLMLHACAKMQDAHGFDPDLVTYNTLLGACARKTDLPRARTILRHLLEHSTFQPDAYTLTNMFWAYANYAPLGSPRRHGSTKDTSEDTAALTNSSLDALLPTNVPTRRATVVAEARGLFAYFEQMEKSMVTTSLLTAYLNTHVMQRQPAKDCLFIYNDLFAKHNCTALPTTYAVMLRSCYNHQDAETAWRIWDDYQQFLEKRAIDNAQQHNVSESEAKQQAVQRQRQQVIEGWTVEHQRKIVLQMASVLAR